ncbi:esterase-like activity of phytase family protein [Vibrio sp. PP-XX7]
MHPYPIAKLIYIGESVLPNDTRFEGVLVGGLSGIDYDPQRQQWLMVSDDRAEKGPARAYLGRITITHDAVSPLTLDKMIQLRQPDGSLYPNKVDYLNNHLGAVPDFESIRFNHHTHGLRYTSEGDRTLQLNPLIRDARLDGHYLGDLPVPNAFLFDPTDANRGFYNNLALEGSSFTPDGHRYFTGMEASLKQDGSPATLTHGSDSRITQYDERGHIIGQYIYPVDPIPAKPGPDKHADNGVSEILAVDQSHLLVLERAGVQDAQGHYHDYIRIYQADLHGATNVADQPQLVKGQYQPMQKQLLLNLNHDDLPTLDNLEGMTFGPRLANGRQTLALISDNNFNASEITQILAFQVVLTPH